MPFFWANVFQPTLNENLCCIGLYMKIKRFDVVQIDQDKKKRGRKTKVCKKNVYEIETNAIHNQTDYLNSILVCKWNKSRQGLKKNRKKKTKEQKKKNNIE